MFQKDFCIICIVITGYDVVIYWNLLQVFYLYIYVGIDFIDSYSKCIYLSYLYLVTHVLPIYLPSI